MTQSLNDSITQSHVGLGIDFHRFTEGRPLVIGGVTIPHTRGLLGHSDADVLTHSLCDALLGAAGLGDIGTHFPDTDERYRGISSLTLLEQVMSLLSRGGWRPVNVDITVIAQEPKHLRVLCGTHRARRSLKDALCRFKCVSKDKESSGKALTEPTISPRRTRRSRRSQRTKRLIPFFSFVTLKWMLNH